MLSKSRSIFKTVKIPIHHKTTKSKLSKLDKITARHTYAIQLYSDKINHGIEPDRSSLSCFEKEIAQKTKLNSAFVQQCKDQSIFMWKSYKRQHEDWQKRLSRIKPKSRLHTKLLKRKPSIPFTKQTKKVPVRLDSRTAVLRTSLDLEGSIVKHLKTIKQLSCLWINLSTLDKGNPMMLALNPGKYHLTKLKTSDKIIDCQFVKHKTKWYLHVTCEYRINFIQPKMLRAIDLGITRSVTTVLVPPGECVNPISVLAIKESVKKDKMHKYDQLISKLQRLNKLSALKYIREKRRNFIEDTERKLSEKIASLSKDCIVAVGYPKRLKYNSFKGNGKKRLRSKLQKWAYNRIINYITQSCEEKGISVLEIGEKNTSKTCSRCGSSDTKRPYGNNWSLFKCNSCNITLNADVNGAVNIAKRSVEKNNLFNRWGTDDLPVRQDDSGYNRLSCQTLNAS